MRAKFLCLLRGSPCVQGHVPGMGQTETSLRDVSPCALPPRSCLCGAVVRLGKHNVNGEVPVVFVCLVVWFFFLLQYLPLNNGSNVYSFS